MPKETCNSKQVINFTMPHEPIFFSYSPVALLLSPKLMQWQTVPAPKTQSEKR